MNNSGTLVTTLKAMVGKSRAGVLLYQIDSHFQDFVDYSIVTNTSTPTTLSCKVKLV